MDQHLIYALGFGMPSGFEWIVIALALLLIFGRRLPEVMRDLGGSVREFKKGMEHDRTAEVRPDQTLPTVNPIAPLAGEIAPVLGDQPARKDFTPPTDAKAGPSP